MQHFYILLVLNQSSFNYSDESLVETCNEV